MIRLDVDAFAQYCQRLTIPSRDEGEVPFRFWGTQRRLIEGIAAGLEQDVHEFVTLKGGRQIGGSTTMDALAIWWTNENDATQGMVVSDDDDNSEYRRDLILGMQESLPREYRWPMPVNNRGMLRWTNASRLSFKAAGSKAKSRLGRSRGLNFLHADEVGAWTMMNAVSALRASLSKRHPARLYNWNSTAQGLNTPFHDMWKTAGKVPTQRQIFLAWWMHELYRLEKPTTASSTLTRDLWGTYAVDAPDTEERQWIAEVKRRYGHTITAAQLGWYRWVLEAEMNDDEAMRAQEYACLPEEAFQAFGEKIIRPELIRSMRLLEKPEPHGYRYEWGASIDEGDPVGETGPQALKGTRIVDSHLDTAALRIWEEPDPLGAYIVAGHPAHSSSPNAGEFVAQVWRAWPDRLQQVATFEDDLAMYQFAWALVHLAGAYRSKGFGPPCFIMEVGGTGYRVLEEIELLQYHGYGLSGSPAKQELHNILGSIRHYFYYRPDIMTSRSNAINWRTSPSNRVWIIHGLRDGVERGTVIPMDERLIDEMASMRRGEDGDNDQIEAGGQGSDAHVLTAAMAVEAWLHSAMPDLLALVRPQAVDPDMPTTAGERLVKNFLSRVLVPR